MCSRLLTVTVETMNECKESLKPVTPFVSRVMFPVSLSPSSSSPKRMPVSKVKKNIAVTCRCKLFIACKKRSPVLRFLMRTMQQVSPVHSVLETNLTLSLFLNQLEYALHLLLFPVTMQQVSMVRLAFERSHNILDFAYTVVKAAFFVVLHLQDPSLQCSPLSHNRNAFVTGGRTISSVREFLTNLSCVWYGSVPRFLSSSILLGSGFSGSIVSVSMSLNSTALGA